MWLIILLIFLVIIYVLVFNKNLVTRAIDTVRDSDYVTSKKIDNSGSKLEIVQLQCIYQGLDSKLSHNAKYLGIVKNNGTSTASFVRVYIDFFDKEGKLVGTDSTIVSGYEIPAGETRSFGDTAIDLISDFEECRARASSSNK